MTLTSTFSNDDIIFAFTRADALSDGVLVALSDQMVNEAGIKVKVAVTRAVWDDYLLPSYLDELPGQSMEGRTWDLLWMFGCAARRSRHTSTIQFRVLFATMGESGSIVTEDVLLKAVCGPGDEGEPVITIMLPEED
ncbi:MAG: hypothetical protein BWY93_01901 [Euryarchaeota archaeon ADurb.BinA087]|jgi:hypothetical protein|nr:MAG: hypothetical protein BWY93_01901 [Euryarchaeota archaeon ADurb.BinA087]HOW34764.1 hypothetical protein [Methanoregulaceae archaeon]